MIIEHGIHRFDIPDTLNQNGFYLIEAMMRDYKKSIECYYVNCILYDRKLGVAIDVLEIMAPHLASASNCPLKVVGPKEIELIEDCMTGKLESIQQCPLAPPIAGINVKELEGREHDSLRQAVNEFARSRASLEEKINQMAGKFPLSNYPNGTSSLLQPEMNIDTQGAKYL